MSLQNLAGTLEGALTWVEGAPPQSVYWPDGESVEDHIAIDDVEILRGTRGFSIFMAMRCENVDAEYIPLCMKKTDEGEAGEYEFEAWYTGFHSGGGLGSIVAILYGLHPTTGNTVYIGRTTRLNHSIWAASPSLTSIAITYNGTRKSSGIQIHVNGVRADKSTYHTRSSMVNRSVVDTPLCILGDPLNSDTGSDYGFLGHLDRLQLYDYNIPVSLSRQLHMVQELINSEQEGTGTE